VQVLKIVLHISFRGRDIAVPCHILHLPYVVMLEPMRDHRSPYLLGILYPQIERPQLFEELVANGVPIAGKGHKSLRVATYGLLEGRPVIFKVLRQ